MNTSPAEQAKKAYEKPVLRREAKLPLVTAGSFDLIIGGNAIDPSICTSACN